MRKRYQVVGFRELVDPKDMIHVLNFSYDGIIGVSTLTHARQTIDIATSTEEHAADSLAPEVLYLASDCGRKQNG